MSSTPVILAVLTDQHGTSRGVALPFEWRLEKQARFDTLSLALAGEQHTSSP